MDWKAITRMKMRLNRYLAECGIASRRKSEELIKEGRVSVNKKIISELSVVINPESDIIALDGEKIKVQKKVYYLLHKPKGIITSTADEKGRPTVINLIDTNQKIFPVGRLDFNTTGVLILTNDGEFSNFVTHPSNKVPREYKVVLDKELSEDNRLKLLKGIMLEGRKSRFEEIIFSGKSVKTKVMVTTVEGRNHFVKNMFSALGYFVKQLERTSFGFFNVKGIPAGSYRILSYAEIKKVYDTFGK
jgi:23S rRNA pseudouridine2605 synthase